MPKKELTLKTLEKADPVASAYYRDVSKNQIFLKEHEEIRLFKNYKALKTSIHEVILSEKSCITELVRIYHERIDANQSVAKLRRDFNNKKSGYNKKIANRLQTAIEKIGALPVKELVKRLNLSDDVYSQLEPYCSKQSRLSEYKLKIAKIEDILVRSCLMAAKEIANKYAGVFGIEVKDAIQEANLAILEAISKYNPDYRTKQGNRVKFLTYAYATAEKKIRELIMNHSRLIHLPRYQLDRIFLVLAAAKLLEPEYQDPILITALANLIMSGKKGRLLQENEVLTEAEVLHCIELLSHPLLLDQIVNDNGGRPNTVGDLIPDEGPTPEDFVEEKNKWDRFEEIMTAYLDRLELRVIQFRFLSGGKKLMTYEKVKEALRLVGFDVSRAKILEAEADAIAKLKKVPEVEELFNSISDN